MTTEQAQQELLEYLATRRERQQQEPLLPSYLDLGRIAQLCVLVPMFTIMAFGLIAFAAVCNEPRPVDEDALATGMAERFVSERLACPATARFSPTPAIERDGNTWRVTSYVDSQNLFGATVRRHWTVTVKAHGLGQWELLNLDWSNL
jgi:hypothetical protein